MSEDIPKSNNVIAFSRSSDRFVKLAEDRLENNDYIGALSMLRRASEIDPTDDSIRLSIADALIEMRCFSDAIEILAPFINNSECEDDAASLLGYCYMSLMQFEAAADCFIKVLNPETDDFRDEYTASIYDALEYCERNMPETLGEDTKPILRDSSEVVIEEALVKVERLLLTDKYSAAIDICEATLAKYPNTGLRLMLLRVCYCAREFDRGIEGIRNTPPKDMERVDILSVAALLYDSANDAENCERCCRKLFEKENLTHADMLCIYSVLIEIGKNDDALRYARMAYEMEPFDRVTIHSYARALCYCDRVSDARKLYAVILKINPNDAIAAYYLRFCSNEAEPIKKSMVGIGYCFPIGEMIERDRILKEMNGSVISNEIKKKWDDGDANLLEHVLWPIYEPSKIYLSLCIPVIVSLGGERADNILRSILLDPAYGDYIRELVMFHLRKAGRYSKFSILHGGRLVFAEIKRYEETHKTLPAAQLNIQKKLKTALEGCSLKAEDSATRLLSKVTTRYASLPVAQQEAIAVAIEYMARSASDGDELSVDEIIELRGITKRRFYNAMEKLIDAIEDNDD